MSKSKNDFMDIRDREEQEKQNRETPVKERHEVSIVPKRLLDLTKSDLSDFARSVVSQVQAGEIDLVETMISVKKAITFFEQLDENIRPIFYGKNIVAKGDILKVHNVEIENADFSKWDFKNCEDEVLIRLEEEVKSRKEFLKLVTSPVQCVDMVTGSEYTCKPPIKYTTSGYKININK